VDALDDQSQGRLAMMLASGKLERPDGKEQAADLRLIAATSRDLATLVAAGQFREELFLRLHQQVVELPTLRERREDVAPLARRFVALFAHQYRKPALSLSPEAMQQLLNHSWPGNVRELRNAIEQAVILCDGLEITPELLPQGAQLGAPAPEVRFPVGTAIKEMEREMIVRTLDANRGNKNRTAKQLGISRRSLYNKLERYRIDAARHH
jgi:DNA-binding NtrC family response regulator